MDIEDFKRIYGRGWLKHYNESKRIDERIEKNTVNKSYKGKVSYYSKKVWEEVENYDKSKHNFKDHHIDHKISLSYGFKYGIPYEVLSHVSNLQFISKEENYIKGKSIIVDDSNRWIMHLMFGA